MKTAKKIFTELYQNGWTNDTLAPLSLRPFEELAAKVLDAKTPVFSALLGKGTALSGQMQQILVLATTHNLVISKANSDFRYKNLVLPYRNLKSFTLWQDNTRTKSFYLQFCYRKKSGLPRILKIEVLDPTSAQHFKDYLDQKLSS